MSLPSQSVTSSTNSRPGRFRLALAIGVGLLLATTVQAQRTMEKLTRALVAVRTGNDVYLAWRLFGDEPHDLGFNVYLGTNKLNPSPLTGATLFTHAGGAAGLGTGSANVAANGAAYTVKPVVNGQEGAASEPARILTQPYLSVPLQLPSTAYTANDASVGDVDGDGEYEIILKWEPNNAKDNSQTGVTDVVYLDAYKLNGQRLWRINLGRNVRAGAHYTQFLVYDFDGDGKAEIMCRTSDGTTDGTGKVIGNANADHRHSTGYIMTGPEFLTVFEGLTGRAMQSTAYVPARGNVCDWGDPNCATYANRVDRFLAGVAYLDGKKPSAVFCRGYYTRTVLVAWDWNGTALTQRWIFDSNQSGNTAYVGQGNHQLSVADVDDDGKDEIIYGAMAVDDNGKGLWNTRLGHGDALHVSDFDPARPGLEVYAIHEGGEQPGADLRSAKTGQVYWKLPNEDVGRGVAADISADHPGAEFWGASGGARNVAGAAVSVSYASANFLAWWDGDLLREMVDKNVIQKGSGTTLLTATGCSSNNGTKATPNLTADLLGDWREEVVWRTEDSKELRIFTTTTSTTHRLYTLMHNPAYRLAVAWQNVAYNQPPHVDYFLGAGMTFPPPKPNIVMPQTTLIRRRAEAAGSHQVFHAGQQGRLFRHGGGATMRLPLGFSHESQVITVRDAFGQTRARLRPQQGQLHLVSDLPEGVYLLQVR